EYRLPKILRDSLPAGCGELQGSRLLRLMGMGGASIDFELSDLLAAELGLRQHPAHRRFDQAFREPHLEVLRRDRPQAPRITGVPVVDLLAELVAAQPNLL